MGLDGLEFIMAVEEAFHWECPGPRNAADGLRPRLIPSVRPMNRRTCFQRLVAAGTNTDGRPDRIAVLANAGVPTTFSDVAFHGGSRGFARLCRPFNRVVGPLLAP